MILFFRFLGVKTNAVDLRKILLLIHSPSVVATTAPSRGSQRLIASLVREVSTAVDGGSKQIKYMLSFQLIFKLRALDNPPILVGNMGVKDY
jgi:hypothetical protein